MSGYVHPAVRWVCGQGHLNVLDTISIVSIVITETDHKG